MHLWRRLAPLGVLALLGQSPPGRGAPAEARLHVRTPGWNARVELVHQDGRRVELGESGLMVDAVPIPTGPLRVCLHNPAIAPHCRDLDLAAGETLRWEVLLSEPEPAPVLVQLPARVVSVRRRVDGVREGAAESVDGTVTVPALRDTWLELTDGHGRRCLCHVPAPTPGETYSCGWPCSDSSDR